MIWMQLAVLQKIRKHAFKTFGETHQLTEILLGSKTYESNFESKEKCKHICLNKTRRRFRQGKNLNFITNQRFWGAAMTFLIIQYLRALNLATNLSYIGEHSLYLALDGSDYSTVHQLSKLREVISTKPNKTRQNRVLNPVLLGVQRRHYLCAMRPHLLIEPKKRLK